MNHFICFLLCLFLFVSCNKQITDAQYKYVYTELNDKQNEDAYANALIEVYKQSLEDEMSEIIAYANTDLSKTQPEGSLGNIMADAILYEAERLTNENIDVGIMNYGGIRIPMIQAGEVSLGTVYELMPFDNFLVTQKLDGATLKALFNSMASRGGWPIAGARYQIRDNMAIDITINGVALDVNKTYTIAISDYLANGGDKLSFLKTIPQKSTNMLLRDAFIHYFEHQKNLTENLEERVRNAE